MAEYLKIATVNAQSILAQFDGFSNYFGDCEFNIVCVCETWLKSSIGSGLVKLHQYNLFRCDRAGRRGGGGGMLHR